MANETFLGFNCFKHDASAALIRNGEIIAAVEEERFIREKHTFLFPQQAIRFCLDFANLKVSDLDGVCFYWNPWLFSVQRLGLGALRLSREVLGPNVEFLLRSAFAYHTVYRRFFKCFPAVGARPRFFYVNHHLAHAASACYPSGFPEAACMVVDGAGEHASLSIYRWRGTEFSLLRHVQFPHSLGFFYSAITDYLGFKPNADEYKIMGYAAYGSPRYLEAFRRLLRPDGRGGFQTDLSFFAYHRWGKGTGWVSKKFCAAFGPPRTPEMPLTEHHANIAASAQAILEEILLDIARWARRRTGLPYLTVAGGVGLNCAANARLLHGAGFRDVFFQPAAADMGTAIGAALYQHGVLTRQRPTTTMRHLDLGPAYTADATVALLKRSKIRYVRPIHLEHAVAEAIAEGNIVGWFQGRMEFGPRALGHRSILADPRRADMKDRLNSAVKFREEFRPFAPSVPEDDAYRYFEIDRPSPYMILLYRVREEARTLLPAITHRDGTARVHTVTADVNPRFYRLLKEFGTITGIPVVVNTSFNVKGQPIVCTPEEALQTFFTTGLDILAIEDFIIWKQSPVTGGLGGTA